MLSFDTTFDSNKYCLVLALFTGVDHHKRCVTFGAALIAHEDIHSFTWVFDSFLEAMGGYEPVCIITDQDPAMPSAIQKVFKKTKH